MARQSSTTRSGFEPPVGAGLTKGARHGRMARRMALPCPSPRSTGGSNPERVLELCRALVEARDVVAVLRAEPPSADHEEQVVAGLHDPTESALEAEDPGLAVVLGEVRPGHVRRDVVVQAAGEELGDEV